MERKARAPHLPEAATKKDVVQGMARRWLHTQSLPSDFLGVRSLRIQSEAETVGSGTPEICELED